jgi:NADH:ubiquinone oxidoreductase subunit 2 (subunit N)
MADILAGSMAWLGLLPLPTAALFLTIWHLGWPRASRALTPHISVGSLVLSLAATINPIRLVANAGGLWALDSAGYIARALFLGAATLSWLFRSQPPASRIASAIELMSLWGGLLALTTQDLATLWIALGLFVLPASLSEPSASNMFDDRQVRQPAIMVLLFGVALLYASSGTLSLTTLNRLLWVRGGPRPALLYIGLALSVYGIGAATRLLPPYGPQNASADAVSPLLGAGLLLRLSLEGSAALAWEWVWLLHALAALAVIWPLATALRTADREVYLGRLTATQRAFLLWAVALGFGAQGREIVIFVSSAFLLGQAVVSVGLQRISFARESEMSSPLVGLARHSPWLGVPFLVALLSQAAFPMTLGFVGRLLSIWAARDQLAPWAAWSGLAASVVCALFYLPTLLAILRRGSRRAYVDAPRALLGGLILAACVLLLLGLYPRPLQILAHWIAGA